MLLNISTSVSDSKWDEFFRRLAKDIEDRMREAFESSTTFLETPVGDYRTPKIDYTVSGQELYVAVEMPGCDKQKIDISVDDSTITIVGEYMTPPPAFSRLYPFTHGRGFRRVVRLPRPVEPSKVEARYEAGVLLVKASIATPKGVKVRVE